ncbi:OmpA family protein [Hymenobacter busanensis]|nr:OmpA family protein [Hymenobacter busanensis]QHJ06842.1 OmpA family protein [Hymenobacter busanensis]
MSRTLPSLILILTAWLVGLGHATQAQTANASINGTVGTEDKLALSGVSITVAHLPSGARQAVLTDANGSFAIKNLLIGGPYVVQVSQPGYKMQFVNDVFLSADKPSTFAFVLRRPEAVATTKTHSGRAKSSFAPLRGGASRPLVASAPAVVPATATASTAPAPAPAPEKRAAAAPAETVAAPSAVASKPEATASAPAPRARRPYTPRKPTKGNAPAVSGHYDAKSGNYIYDTGAPTTIKLASGGVIEGVGVNSTENLLHRFITDAQAKVDTADLTQGWINFDRVYFDAGKATLTKESVGQLRNIAAIMRAYPATRIKIGGYSDSTGTYKVNKLLSDARAQAAWATLVEMGVSPRRMDARGYGPRYGIAPNTTEEGRAMNRRLSVKVLAK